MPGTFLDGERLEKGGKRKLEVGRSVITIGRCTMTLQLMRQKVVEPERRRGEAADSREVILIIKPITKPCVRSLIRLAASHMLMHWDMATRKKHASSSPGVAAVNRKFRAPVKAMGDVDL